MKLLINVFSGYTNPAKLVDSATFLFQFANTDCHLALLVKILTDAVIDQTVQPFCEKGGYFTVVLEQILSRNCQLSRDSMDLEGTDLMQMWYNLRILLK